MKATKGKANPAAGQRAFEEETILIAFTGRGSRAAAGLAWRRPAFIERDMAKTELDDFRVPFFDDGKKPKPFDLNAVDPREALLARHEGGRSSAFGEIGAQLDELQEKLHAQRRQRVLLVLQGMDTSGKDGTIRAVLHEVDPLGLRIVPFGAGASARPRTRFPWRIHAQAPMAGELCVFNRSHYEDVLVPPVLKLIDDERMRAPLSPHPRLRARCWRIRERRSSSVSCTSRRTSSAERLQARIDDPTKHWKFDASSTSKRASSGTTTSTPSAPRRSA